MGGDAVLSVREQSEEVGMTAVVTSEFSERVYFNSFSICFRWSEELFDPGYAKHMFNSPEIRRDLMCEWCHQV